MDHKYAAFTALLANVKGPVNITLGPKTAIVGKNRTAKTSILDTIRLALTGKHPIGPHPVDLSELMPPNAQRLHVAITGPSGEGRLLMEAPDGKARKPKHTLDITPPLLPTHADNILPLDSVGELLRFGTKRAREALTRRFGVSDAIATPRGLSNEQLELWSEAQDEHPETDPALLLVEMSKWFRGEALARNKRAAQLEESIATRKARLADEVVGVELISDYEAKLKRAEAWERSQSLRDRKTTVDTRIVELREALKVADAEAATGDAKRTETSLAVLRQLLGLCEGTTCALCKTTNVDLAARRDEIQVMIDSHDTTETNPRSDIVREIERLQAESAGLDAGLDDVPDDYTGLDADTLRETIATIRTATTIQARLQTDTKEMHRLQRSAEACKVLERESAKLLKGLLTNVADRAEDAVNRYMPEGFRAKLVVTDKAVEWRVIGQDGHAHKRGGMSGSEYGSLVVAVACAWTEGSPLRVVLLDDIDLGPFDPDNIGTLLEALGTAVDRGDLTQVIVCWSRPNEIPAGWHMVERSLG